MNRDEIMRNWDKWRKYIADGGQASWPRDAFESLLDFYDEKIESLQRQLQPEDSAESITCPSSDTVSGQECGENR